MYDDATNGRLLLATVLETFLHSLQTIDKMFQKLKINKKVKSVSGEATGFIEIYNN